MSPVHPVGKEVLLHPRRAAILAHLQAHPGSSFRGTCNALGIHLGTGRHHLTILKRAGLVWEARQGIVQCWFPGHRPPVTEVVRLVQLAGLTTLEHGILRLLLLRPLHQKAVRATYPTIPGSTVQHNLSRLERRGLVRVTWHGRFKVYAHVDYVDCPEYTWAHAVEVPA